MNSTFVWNSILRAIALSSFIILLTSCAGIERSPKSGYYKKNTVFDSFYDPDFNSNALDREAIERDDAARDIGFSSTRSLSYNEKQSLDDRLNLVKAEKNLTSKKEKEQYYKYKPYMKSDKDRLEFLEITSIEGRQRWADSHNLGDTDKFSSDIQAAVDSEDILAGMTKQAVRESWGDPLEVEVAGNPVYGNERWKYTRSIASPEGYVTETRFIYFESGRVAGWDKF